MRSLALLVMAACGTDVGAPPAAALPPRVRLLTDTQYANAVHELLGLDVDPPHTPGTVPHQFIHEASGTAIDAPQLVQYRIHAADIAKRVAECDTSCVEPFATRAFRRPLDDGELARLLTLHAAGGFSLVVETVLQTPSFLYRAELDDSPYAIASELGFLFLDSLPDEPLWDAARHGAIDVDAQVDRLLELPRVRSHITEVVLAWLDLHDIETLIKTPPLADETRASMFEQTRRFVDDVLWQRGGSLSELLTSNRTFVDARLAGYYADARAGWTLDLMQTDRAGILSHPGVLAMLASPKQESIIKRGIYVQRKFLCTEELGRPPFAAIRDTTGFTDGFSEAQLAHFRANHVYCSSCHRQIDPPGFALHHYDGTGAYRVVDANEAAIDDDIQMALDGRVYHLNTAADLGQMLAGSERVAACVVDQIAHHALGRSIPDVATQNYLHRRFERSDHDIVDVFRAIATSPLFRGRGEAARQSSRREGGKDD